jgi:tetratricopeptide (TPR) repeat protein
LTFDIYLLPFDFSKWILALLLAFGASVTAQNWLDAQNRVPLIPEDALYIRSSEILKRASLGFTGLMADAYWINTTLYFGEKFQQQRLTGEQFDVGRLELLKPMLELVTELDPRHVAAYRFGGFFLLYDNPAEAINFIQRGIRNNPNEWRLYQDLGFTLWRLGKFREAAAAYQRGSQTPNAPAWLQPMAATVLAKGGDRETARQMFQRLYEESEDGFVRQVCEEQLQLLKPTTDHQSPITNEGN